MERGQEFKATFTNLQVTGPSQFTIEKMKWVYIRCEHEIRELN